MANQCLRWTFIMAQFMSLIGGAIKVLVNRSSRSSAATLGASTATALRSLGCAEGGSIGSWADYLGASG